MRVISDQHCTMPFPDCEVGADSIWPDSSEGRNKRWQQQWVVGWARVTGVTEVTYVLRLLLLL